MRSLQELLLLIHLKWLVPVYQSMYRCTSVPVFQCTSVPVCQCSYPDCNLLDKSFLSDWCLSAHVGIYLIDCHKNNNSKKLLINMISGIFLPLTSFVQPARKLIQLTQAGFAAFHQGRPYPHHDVVRIRNCPHHIVVRIRNCPHHVVVRIRYCPHHSLIPKGCYAIELLKSQ